MRTFESEKNYAVWNDSITKTLLKERTTSTTFPINPDEVMPRYLKAAQEQKDRTDSKAEVFTPYEIVKKMNDMCEEEYAGDIESFIKSKVLEITCGEAPFLATRYDVATGKKIPLEKRIGLLDRKLRCIPGIVGKEGWKECATAALKSVYGYEWQFDNLFLARRNLLMDTIEWYVDRFGEEPGYNWVSYWAEIISYNIFRMDGVSLCIPETKIPAKTMNWETGRMESLN